MSKNVKAEECPFHSTTSINGFDMLDEQIRRHPWPYYDWLRQGHDKRVYQLVDDRDFYILHRYEDVKNAFINTTTLKSQIIPTRESLFVALMDDQEHRRVRSILSSIFTINNVSKLTPTIKSIAEECTKAATGREIDLLKGWAIPIPMKVLARLLNLPLDDGLAKKLYSDALAINRAIFVTGGTGPRRSSKPTFYEKLQISFSLFRNIPRLLKLASHIGWPGIHELGRKFKLVNRKLALPRPNFESIPAAIKPFLDLLIRMGEQLDVKTADSETDQLSDLKSAIKEGRSTKLEMMLATAFILFAGHETSISLLSNCFVHLAKHPDLYDQLKNDRNLVEPFIEESLRYYTPVGRFLRRVVKPLTFDDVTIPKDAIVILMPGAANTDSSKFEQGCIFDINRSNRNQHLSFGKGQHYCLGAQLARTMVKHSILELLNQSASISVLNEATATFVTDRDNGVFRYEKLNVSIKS